MAKTIGVLSLKGGVGKTSAVVALGDALSNFGKKVLLVDANFSAPNLGIHFNTIDPETTLHDVLSKKVNISQAIKKATTMKGLWNMRGKTHTLSQIFYFLTINKSISHHLN